MGLEILFYVPNLIGYLRLILMGLSWITFYNNPWLSMSLYTASISLDFVDGWSARKLNQTSAFGAWFDVVIDTLGRGMLWCRLYTLGYLVSCLEWCCFVCTHTLGSNWKSSFVKEPWFVQAVMAKNFRTPMGFFAIAGLHLLPLCLYCHRFGVLVAAGVPASVQAALIALLITGRVVCASVETWCVWSHILYLTGDEANRSYVSGQSSKNGAS